mgnify:CR=1 FL=1
MSRILIFGGTTEGRLLAQYCHEQKKAVWVSVATGYGKMVLPESPYLFIHETPMDEGEMEQFISDKGIALVFDATHPYASLVSKNIAEACERTGARRIRVIRESLTGKEGISEDGRIVWVESVEEAVQYLCGKAGNLLVTTGSKELIKFTALDSFEERVYARVLPTVSVIAACEKIGIKGKHLIGMQGPFSVEMNEAMIRQFEVRYLVTKESGNAGGFLEKMKAAAECGITAVVVGRPSDETGMTAEEAKKVLAESESDRIEPASIAPVSAASHKRKVTLIGTGMGGPEQMTGQAQKVLKSCDVVFGAERMLENAGEILKDKKKLPWYLSKDILPWLEAHKEFKTIGILYSGDTGFYSGAKKMVESFQKEPYGQSYETEVLPGISSVSYLCSRLKTGWEDVLLFSLHGREGDIAEAFKRSDRVFALLDGTNTVNHICGRLIEAGYADVKLSVGERLSYSDERITTGTPKTLRDQKFDVLSAVLIER